MNAKKKAKQTRKPKQKPTDSKKVQLKRADAQLDPSALVTIQVPCGLLEAMIQSYKASDPLGIYKAAQRIARIEDGFAQWKIEQTAPK